MDRNLIEDLHQYFEQKDVQKRTGEEVYFLNQLKEQLPYFKVTSVHRDDLKHRGFDVTDVADADMKELASRLQDDYCNQLFWESLEIIAEQGLDIPRYICPKCGKSVSRYDSDDNRFECYSCDNSWKKEEPTGRYVLVEHPENSQFYSDCEVGYESYNSEDNGAMYVPEHFYIAHENKEPNPENIYIPVTWPDSQEYMELQYESESDFERCELIEHGKAFSEFGSQAIWVPEKLIVKQ